MFKEKLKKMQNKITQVFETPENVRIGIFNLMSFVGFCVSLIVFISSLFNDAAFMNLLAMGISAVLSISLFIYSRKTGKYKRCYIITIVVLFIFLFPVMFFTAGGMHSGMPVFFSFAAVFTIFMLENKLGLIIAAIELIEYLVCCILSMKFPSMVIFFETEEAVYKDVILGIVACTVSLAVTVYLQAMLYTKQHNKTQEALKDAELQSKAKDIFLANMSHELRTPINILLGMCEMIERTSLDEQVLSFNHNIRLFANQLQDMVKDLLDITKIKTGQMSINNVAYNLEEVVSELEVTGKELARRKNLSFTLIRNYKKSYSLVGDSERLKQVVTNLINNAIKYTQTGFVKVYLDVEEKNGKCYFEFLVEDSGIGIPEEEQDKIFEMFHRIDNAHSNKIEGTGLGLAITKQLLECMNGNISLESKVGVGSKFRGEIEQDISEKEVEMHKNSEDLHFIAPEAKILIVDDNRDNLSIMKLILERTMLKIDTAEGGEEAIALAQNKQYDIIVLDYMMPGMDGIETICEMKKNGIDSVYISLTADAVVGTAEKIYAAGFDEYVTKPVNWNKFEKLLMRYIPKEKIVYETEKENILDVDAKISELNERIPGNRLEISSAIKRVGDNLNTYARILRLFGEHYDINALESKKFFEKEDYKSLNYIVHSLKSQALGIGAAELHKNAMALEAHLKEGDTDYARCAFPLLLLMWERAVNDAQVLADEILKTFDKHIETSESEEQLIEKAKEALKNSIWLEAKAALETLINKYPEKDIYAQVLEKADNLEFTKAEELLESQN